MLNQTNIIYLKSVDSTNNYARNLLNRGEVPEGTVICAGYQTGGRGQSNNSWESESDSNLLVSMIFFPLMIRPEDQFVISMAVSLGLKDLLDNYTEGIKIKWPNDIYSGSDKIAGILIENAIAGNKIIHTIAGIGLNVNQERFLSDAPNPVSLKQATGKLYETRFLLEQLISSVQNRYIAVTTNGRKAVAGEYHNSMWRLGEWHTFRADSGIFPGQITGTDDRGCLLVRHRSGVIKNYAFKEIEYL
jgi:BirA family transcriptional regulator, biotin operon repressor / biotin---[acetyl-CoA-carboxylase] ligase